MHTNIPSKVGVRILSERISGEIMMMQNDVTCERYKTKTCVSEWEKWWC